ncbi:MAG: MBL fold metallo-hydrolase [Deltaproteobacteria bacterium]|nr:MBL fold metallo-hydrolase [Deltaproteobacteria bacterium]
MKLTILGSGCPSVDLERHGPSALIDCGEGARILIDCGSGVTQRLLEHGIPGSKIDALLLTHLHSDHIVDLFQLIISSWHQGRPGPQKIYGPPGTQAYVDQLMKLWKPELTQRIAHEQRSSTKALEVEVAEIENGTELKFGKLKVKAVEVLHQPVKHAFGFVFETEDEKAVISGDTKYCPALIEAAKGADVLLHEVFIHGEMPVITGLRTAKTVENVASYHTLDSVVGIVAAEAEVRCLMLTHFAPPKFNREKLLSTVYLDFKGPVLIGEDLMTFDLERNSLSWKKMTISLGAHD